MQQCPHCEGFLPPQTKNQCPHCDIAFTKGLSRPLKRVGQLVLGAGAVLTLSACYGAPPPSSLPPCDDTTQSGQTPKDSETPAGSPSESPSEAPCTTPSPSDGNENTTDAP